MERTTDLQKIKGGCGFTWGDVIKIHEVGEYAVIEYHPWKQEGCSLLAGNSDKSQLSFHCYLNGRDMSRSTESLDSALATCIAYKHEGSNSRAATYFFRMLEA